MNIKIPTTVAIKSLEGRLADLKKSISDYKALSEKYEEDNKKWEINCLNIMKREAKKPSNYSTGAIYRARQCGYEFTLRFDSGMIKFPPAPKEPVNPESKNYGTGRQYKTIDVVINEIENTLRLLKMTSQKEISTASYKEVMQYL